MIPAAFPGQRALCLGAWALGIGQAGAAAGAAGAAAAAAGIECQIRQKVQACPAAAMPPYAREGSPQQRAGVNFWAGSGVKQSNEPFLSLTQSQAVMQAYTGWPASPFFFFMQVTCRLRPAACGASRGPRPAVLPPFYEGRAPHACRRVLARHI